MKNRWNYIFIGLYTLLLLFMVYRYCVSLETKSVVGFGVIYVIPFYFGLAFVLSFILGFIIQKLIHNGNIQIIINCIVLLICIYLEQWIFGSVSDNGALLPLNKIWTPLIDGSLIIILQSVIGFYLAQHYVYKKETKHE